MKKHYLLLFVFFTGNLLINAQVNNNYERVKIGEAKQILCGLDIAPDESYIAISSTQSFPFYKFDWQNKSISNEFNVGNWYAGSSIKHSEDGKYILLQQLYYVDWAPNKDREVNFEIIESATGKQIIRFDEYHAMAFTPDNEDAISLTSEEVAFWSLETGKKGRSFKVNNATNGVAISPDGKYIAVAHRVDGDELKKNPRFKKDKKALKHAIKFKQQISIYDAVSFEFQYSVNELYDIVYKLEYSPDGNTLFCLQIPHLKAQANENTRQTYLSTIDGKTGEPRRRGFTSQSLYEPDFKLSNDGKWLGLVSKGKKFIELHIYNFETGQMVDRFEQSYRLFEKNDGEMIVADSRTSFVFLPDNKTIVMTMGNHLIYWTPQFLDSDIGRD
jgi:WD40 repeat protein